MEVEWLAPEQDAFSNLPTHLIEKIFVRLLDNPPFSTLYLVCRVCRRWMGIMRTMRLSTSYLAYLHLGQLRVFHSKSGLWEVFSLQFCQDQLPDINLEHLQICSTSRGVFILSGHGAGYYVVCNPLTERCIKLEGAGGFDKHHSEMAKCALVVAEYIVWTKVTRPTTQSTSQEAQYSWMLQHLRIIHREVSRQFELVVHHSPENRPRMHAYELGGGKHWTLPDDFSFLMNPDLKASPGFVMLGFSLGATGWVPDFKTLYYDVVEEKLKWQRTMDDRLIAPDSLTSFFGSITMDHEHHLKFVKVSSLGGQRTISYPRSLNSVCTYFMHRVSRELFGATPLETLLLQRRVHMTIIFVEGQDVVFYVAILRMSRQYRPPVSLISVWTHNPLEQANRIPDWVYTQNRSSDLISDWHDWLYWADEQQPVGSDFHIFKPSFESPSILNPALYKR